MALLLAAAVTADRSAPAQALQSGVFPDRWIDGSDCAREANVQIHLYNADTVILRQSLCTSFEGPFLYMLFGTEEAFLLDTGAGGIDIASTVDELVRNWESQSGRRLRRLVVAHSHAHRDHVAGDEPLRALHYAKVVDRSPDEVAEFFGFADWRDGMASLDLGGRTLDIIPIPGHEPSHIAIYDRRVGTRNIAGQVNPSCMHEAGTPLAVLCLASECRNRQPCRRRNGDAPCRATVQNSSKLCGRPWTR